MYRTHHVYNAPYVYIAPGEEFKYTESSEGQVKAKSALKSAATSNNSPSKINHEAQKSKALRPKPKSPKAKTTRKRIAQ